jgi:hypothetical protein
MKRATEVARFLFPTAERYGRVRWVALQISDSESILG